MKQPIIYLVADQAGYLLGICSLPELAAKFYLNRAKLKLKDCKLYCLTEPISWGRADYIYHQITTIQERTGKNQFQNGLFGFFKEDLADIVENKVAAIKRATARLEINKQAKSKQIDNKEIKNLSFPQQKRVQKVYKLLQGQQLYLTEIKQAVEDNDLSDWELDKVLIYLKLVGKLQIQPAVSYQTGELVCSRCGSQNLVAMDCNYCQQQDYYCRDCIALGEARLCRPLFVAADTDCQLKLKQIKPKLEFSLTDLQQKVAGELLDFWYQNYQTAFVWAVCGAGKTEVTFQLIADVISQGSKVLFAIPRKDVVVELAARLEEAFPGLEIKTLYGGSENKYVAARLVVATTHQLLRYHQGFDLVILDEMDAFPYQDNQILERAVKEATKADGKLVYMTATPQKEHLAEIKQDQQAKLIKLSARYHGQPLPEPELMRADLNYNADLEKVALPSVVINKVKLSVKEDLAQLFIFVPTQKLVTTVTETLQDYLSEVKVRGSHAQDELRATKREEFIAGEFPVLVSTTIMERGVTVKQANVLVLFADWEFVFTDQSLIQMAGRSGRSIEHPEGKVWFIGQEITEEMQAAQQMICELNDEAREKGYLK